MDAGGPYRLTRQLAGRPGGRSFVAAATRVRVLATALVSNATPGGRSGKGTRFLICRQRIPDFS